MGDISIIARRLTDGHVQYGWSGNGGYFCVVGAKLLAWYENPKDVEYLFGLGQTKRIGQVGSEKGGFRWFETNEPVGEGFWLGTTEREIFSKIAFIDYGYFFDTDNKWYYVAPTPFRIKMPLELIENHLDDRGYEFDYLEEIHKKIVDYMFGEYRLQNPDFNFFLESNGYDVKKVIADISKKGRRELYELYNEYRKIWEYFDDWIVIKCNSDYTEICDIILRKEEGIHIETNLW